MTDKEFDEVNEGSDCEIKKKLYEFWKKHDPTPYTAYNEAMTEYYNRVDYAFFNFQTTLRNDGALTDRGKIYILYGKPDSMDRNLTENSTFEIWKYTKLNKKIKFQTQSTGDFKLIEVIEK